MIKKVNGKDYESVPQPEPFKGQREVHPKCVGCCADEDNELCLKLSHCAHAAIIWKEVSND